MMNIKLLKVLQKKPKQKLFYLIRKLWPKSTKRPNTKREHNLENIQMSFCC